MNRGELLLVEDETDVLLSNQEYLQKCGFGVWTAETLAEAWELLQREHIDLIVLDINLPDGSGLDFISKIRESTAVPVIFLTCHTDKTDMLEGFLRGGDDYVTKPYDLEVLLARITALLRRNRPAQDDILSLGGIVIDPVRRSAFLDGKDALLKPREFALLLFLAQNSNRVFSGEQLYKAVWGRDANSDTRTVRVHIHAIRKKLNMTAHGYPRIDTAPGGGYAIITSL